MTHKLRFPNDLLCNLCGLLKQDFLKACSEVNFDIGNVTCYLLITSRLTKKHGCVLRFLSEEQKNVVLVLKPNCMVLFLLLLVFYFCHNKFKNYLHCLDLHFCFHTSVISASEINMYLSPRQLSTLSCNKIIQNKISE